MRRMCTTRRDRYATFGTSELGRGQRVLEPPTSIPSSIGSSDAAATARYAREWIEHWILGSSRLQRHPVHDL